jgi:hypothetical protein
MRQTNDRAVSVWAAPSLTGVCASARQQPRRVRAPLYTIIP